MEKYCFLQILRFKVLVFKHEGGGGIIEHYKNIFAYNAFVRMNESPALNAPLHPFVFPFVFESLLAENPLILCVPLGAMFQQHLASLLHVTVLVLDLTNDAISVRLIGLLNTFCLMLVS